MNSSVVNSEKKKISTKLLICLLLSSSIILFGTTGYFFYQYQKLFKSPVASQVSAEEEAKKLAGVIGKLMLLPKDETPTVATVTDIEKLKDQPFFKNAVNGNKVLIYPNAKLAIIFDPKVNLIVNVGPINFSQQQTPQAQKTRIALRNGTNVAGLTYKMETIITKLFPELEVTLKDQGKRTDYEKTIVVALNEGSNNTAVEMAKTLNSQTGTLPEGEIKPANVDILIIVGKDKI